MNELNLTANLILRKHKEQNALPVRERDWEKIEDMVRYIPEINSTFQVLASLVFGVTFALLTLILLFFIGDGGSQSEFLVTGNFVVSAIVGIAIALFILARQQRLNVRQAVERILDEMDLVQKEFSPVSMATQVSEKPSEDVPSVAEQFLK